MGYEYENEIDLIELCHHLLKRWRVIILVAVIGAVLLGSYNGYKQTRPQVEATEEVKKEILNKYKENLTDLEVKEVDALVDLYKSYTEIYADRELYGEKSILLNMDPEHVFYGKATYMISDYYDNQGKYVVENSDAGNIVALYRLLLTDDEAVEQINASTGWNAEQQYIREIIDVDLDGISLLIITVISPSEEECQKILNVLEDRLVAIKDEVSKNAQHDIKKISESYSEEYSQSVSDAKKGQNDTLAALKTTMRNISTPLTSGQKSYYSECIKQLFPDEIKEKRFSKTSLIKFILIGFIGGALVVAFWFAFRYVLRQVLRTSDDMNSLFKTRVIGSVKLQPDNTRKRILSGVDKWIEGLFDKRDRFLPYDEAVQMIASEIEVGIEKNDCSNAIITGSCMNPRMSIVVEDIRKRLPESVTLSPCGSVITDSEALKIFYGSDGVVLIEKKEESKLSDISKELDFCRQYGINVLGAVLVM